MYFIELSLKIWSTIYIKVFYNKRYFINIRADIIFRQYYYKIVIRFDSSSIEHSGKTGPSHGISLRLGEGNAFMAVKCIVVRERGTRCPRANTAADFIRSIQCVILSLSYVRAPPFQLWKHPLWFFSRQRQSVKKRARVVRSRSEIWQTLLVR